MKTAIVNGLMLLAIHTACFTSRALAQTGVYTSPGAGPTEFSGGYWPGYSYGGGYHSSTAAEGWYRGRADLVRAYGESNYFHSMAQVYWEQAREKAIANRTASVEQFFALRKFNEEQRLGDLAKNRLSKEQRIAIARDAAPDRLDEGHWNPVTDGLAWPAALQSDRFQEACKRLDELFRLRRDASGLMPEELREAKQLVSAMTAGLKSMIKEVSPSDYTAAKRFLTSVGYEARFHQTSGERIALR